MTSLIEHYVLNLDPQYTILEEQTFRSMTGSIVGMRLVVSKAVEEITPRRPGAVLQPYDRTRSQYGGRCRGEL